MHIERVQSTAAARIVAEPYLVEDELSQLAQQCSQDWLQSLPKERLDPTGPAPVSLEILNGGKFYYSKAAWDAVHPENPCGLLKLRARRGHASGASYGGPAHNDQNLEKGMELYRSPGSDWCVRLWEIPEDLGLTGPVLVGDTIATGTTLVGVLGWLVEKMEAAGAVHDIFVFTIVGASSWSSGDGGVLDKLKHVDDALRRHGKELSICFANAYFALDANGTDLNPSPERGAEWIPAALEAVTKRVGDFPLTDLKCGVWDWGDRFTKALHHLEEVAEHYESFGERAPLYIVEGLRTRIEQRRSADDDAHAAPKRAHGSSDDAAPKKAKAA